MNALILLARIAAPVLALFCVFGLLFFADFYFAPDNRLSLLIYGFPVPALLIGALTPRKWLKNAALAAAVVLIEIAAIIALTVTLYRDINLINGADWPAAVIRLVLIAVAVLLCCSALRQRTLT